MKFEDYKTEGFYDELFENDGVPIAMAMPLLQQVSSLPHSDLLRRQKASEKALHQQGITFAVYGNKKGTEKILPFDILPRIVPAQEWEILEKGIKQRIQALNMFVDDVYNDQRILKDKIIPESLVLTSECYLHQCKGLKPPKGIWIHISGVDLVRDGDGAFYVLEDNLRCPSGISYVLQNRAVQKRTFPKAFQTMRTRPVADYGDHLYDALKFVGPDGVDDPNIIVLTPGIYNSAYY